MITGELFDCMSDITHCIVMQVYSSGEFVTFFQCDVWGMLQRKWIYSEFYGALVNSLASVPSLAVSFPRIGSALTYFCYATRI